MAVNTTMLGELRVTSWIEPEEMDSPSDSLDDEAAAWVWEQLASGNRAAWCTYWVRVKLGAYTGKACVGCCSYASLEELERDLREDLTWEALADMDRDAAHDRKLIAERTGWLAEYAKLRAGVQP